MKFLGILELDFYKIYKNKITKALFIIPTVAVLFLLLSSTSMTFSLYITSTTGILAFVFSGVMLGGILLANNDDDIFKIINIKPIYRIVSKIINIIPIAIYCNLIIIIVTYSIGLISNIEIDIINYYLKYILAYSIVYSIVFSTIGYFLGVILGNILNNILSYIIGVIVIYFLAGIGSNPSTAFLIGNIDPLTSLNPFKFDLYAMKNLSIWISISLILFIFVTIIIFFRQRKKTGFILIIPLIILVYAMGLQVKDLKNYTQNRIGIYNRILLDQGMESQKSRERVIDISKTLPVVVDSIGDEGFIIKNYNMKLDLDDNLKNKCQIKISIVDKNIKELKFQFYGRNKISNLKINNNDVNYRQDESTLYIDMVNINSDETLDILIEYSSYIYTYTDVWSYHYVNRSGALLDRNIAWYPKLNNTDYKDYIIEVNSKYDNLFSNLNVKVEKEHYLLTGSSNDVMLLGGDKSIVCKTVNNIEYYGLDININDKNINATEEFLKYIKEINSNNIEEFNEFYPYVTNIDETQRVFIIKLYLDVYQYGNSIES